MRLGISSRGKWWMSMGPLGWIVFGPFIVAVLLAIVALQLLWLLLVVAPVHLVRWIREQRQIAGPRSG